MSKRRGFSLVEAAIVLGVIGLVVGGIWIAAAQLANQQRITTITSGTLLTANNIRKLFPAESYPGSGGTIFVDGALIRLGILPGDWANGNTVALPGGGTASVGLFAPGVVGGQGITFRVMVTVNSVALANNLAKSFSQAGTRSGLVLVQCFPSPSGSPMVQQTIPYAGFYDCPTPPAGEAVSVSAFFTP